MKRTFHSKVIAYRKDDAFLAVALDFDILAEGYTMGDALDKLQDAINGYLAMCLADKESDKEIYRKTEKKYFDIYNLFEELDDKKAQKELIKLDGFAGLKVYNPTELSHA